jgi:hypothetical protein
MKLMPCDKYKDLEVRERSVRGRFAQYTYKQNEHLWGVSKTAAARIAKEEKRNMVALQNEMFTHRRSCAVCRVDQNVDAG